MEYFQYVFFKACLKDPQFQNVQKISEHQVQNSVQRVWDQRIGFRQIHLHLYHSHLLVPEDTVLLHAVVSIYS